MKTETVRIKLVNKEGNQTTDKFAFIDIPVTTYEILFNQIFIVEDFGCIFLN
ncbi:hypothetical protein [Tenacibaculum sp. nBUS_03]|uniref:hypothetical protein n=1 Tax=Tenacibaculum sp. nBUS_03 TaxID=3395320 RepID=UPI003EB8A9FE